MKKSLVYGLVSAIASIVALVFELKSSSEEDKEFEARVGEEVDKRLAARESENEIES